MTTTIPEPQVTLPAVLDPRVVRGAELLDERMPGWPLMIDLDAFELANGAKCVLGQIGLCVYDKAEYGATGDRLLGDAWGPEAYAHGFLGSCVTNGEGDWQRLDQDWRLAILARRTS